MYLKSLTLKGFKSFASSTTMQLEPGITCIVGPNGSGKSNVVDALAWVMGEQGAKSLRGGKMEDVIFAGTSGRPPLGRAEVVLTIDNSDGALPIEYAEVTISRTMFRTGGSEYAINGTPCRLLDIQELLSDSGVGRQQHVIVSQGQIDATVSTTEVANANVDSFDFDLQAVYPGIEYADFGPGIGGQFGHVAGEGDHEPSATVLATRQPAVRSLRSRPR